MVPGDPDSYLIHKLEAAPGIVGERMPRNAGPFLTAGQISIIRRWIELGVNGRNAMDVIFCRNVLMYFSPDRAMKIGQRFYQSLVDGGWLILSPVEVATELYPQFKQTAFPAAIFYHKTKITEPQVMMVEYPAPLPPQQLDGGTTPEHGSWPPSSVQNEEVPLLPEAAEIKNFIETTAEILPQAAELCQPADGRMRRNSRRSAT